MKNKFSNHSTSSTITEGKSEIEHRRLATQSSNINSQNLKEKLQFNSDSVQGVTIHTRD